MKSLVDELIGPPSDLAPCAVLCTLFTE